MARDGSDWDYINEHMGGHDEDGLPNFMNEPGFSDEHHQSPQITSLKFNSFEEAKNWSLNNKGKAFTRSPDGNGFVPKVNTLTKKTFPTHKKVGLLPKRRNRFQRLEGGECVKILTESFSKYSTHLLSCYMGNKSFSREIFLQELGNLNEQQIIELKNIIDEYVEIDKKKLQGLESFIRKYKKKPRKYGISDQYQWINDLEASSNLCQNQLT